MTKNVIKYSLGAIGVVFIGLISLYFLRTWLPEYKAMKEVERIKKEYAEDPYGGYTPEETMRLFIEALKKGDVELASRYYVMEKQAEWRNKFNIAQQNNHLQLYIDEAEKADFGKEIYPGNYLFTIAENGKAKFTISLVLNSKNQRWKITEL